MSVVAAMADDLAVSSVRLDCAISCSLTLIAAGWRGRVVGENLDAAMVAAQNMAGAHSGDAVPAVPGSSEPASVGLSAPDLGVSSLHLPGASASGPFGDVA